jgi:ribosomal protein L14
MNSFLETKDGTIIHFDLDQSVTVDQSFVVKGAKIIEGSLKQKAKDIKELEHLSCNIAIPFTNINFIITK